MAKQPKGSKVVHLDPFKSEQITVWLNKTEISRASKAEMLSSEIPHRRVIRSVRIGERIGGTARRIGNGILGTHQLLLRFLDRELFQVWMCSRMTSEGNSCSAHLLDISPAE